MQSNASVSLEGFEMAKLKRTKKIEGHVERQLITGMIVSTKFCRQMKGVYKPDQFEIPYARKVARWCMRYFNRYGKAPRKHIQDIYNSEVRKGKVSEGDAELIGKFLASISKEYQRRKKFNADYVMDLAVPHFSERKLRMLMEDVENELSEGDIRKAEHLLTQYKQLPGSSSKGTNPFTDKELIRRSCEETSQPLFTMPGAFGDLVNDHLVREGLIGLMGPEKRGKTWMLDEFAFRALLARNNVALFEVGDLGELRQTVRLHTRLLGKPFKKKDCGEILIPTLDCVRNQEDRCRKKMRKSKVGLGGAEEFEDTPKKYKPCAECALKKRSRYRGTMWWVEKTIEEPWEWREGLRRGRSFMKSLKGARFMMYNCPSETINVDQIRAQLDAWDRFEQFVPDVIVIDYADILASEPGRREDRHKQDATWKALRALSLERHGLVITATQASAKSYDSKTLKLKHFSEDKRKYAHVTGMLSLNQDEDEKEKGILRVAWLLLREDHFDSSASAKVLQCLDIGRPCIASYW